MHIIKQFKKLILAVALLISMAYPTSIFAEQYSIGTHSLKSKSGQLIITVGHVSHFNANDFYVYTFLYQPNNSKEWHQIPRVDKEDDAKMFFTLQTKHNADAVVFDGKIIEANSKFYLLTANKELKPGTTDEGPVTLIFYELVKVEDYERWVFTQKNTLSKSSTATIEQLLDLEAKAVIKNQTIE